MPGTTQEVATAILPESLGCMPHCTVGKELLEMLGKTSRVAPDNIPVTESIATEAQEYVHDHPCQTVKDGKCRLAEYLVTSTIGYKIIFDEKNISIGE